MKYFGKDDIIMADHGFFISEYLENIGASVIYRLFLNGSEQLIKKAKLKESQAIASVRIS